MYPFWLGLFILMCMVGSCCALCLFYGKLLCPAAGRDLWAVVWGSGAGDGLEQRVRCLAWLQNCGLRRCAVVVADGGLDADGRALAARLAGCYPGVILCSRQELELRIQNR